LETKNKKQDQIIRAGRNLFWKYGIRRVSVEEICLEAGVSKMTFYKHFTNKTSLALFILKQFYSDAMTEYHRIMDSDVSYPEKIEKGIELKLKNAQNLSQEFVDELYKNGDSEIMAFMQEMVKDSLDAFMTDFKTYQQKGEIRRDVKPEFMLYMLNKMVDMTTDDHFVCLFENPGEMVRTVSSFYFYGIMPVEEGVIKK
jgi:AcrR family transcriptional regulator